MKSYLAFEGNFAQAGKGVGFRDGSSSHGVVTGIVIAINMDIVVTKFGIVITVGDKTTGHIAGNGSFMPD